MVRPIFTNTGQKLPGIGQGHLPDPHRLWFHVLLVEALDLAERVVMHSLCGLGQERMVLVREIGFTGAGCQEKPCGTNKVSSGGRLLPIALFLQNWVPLSGTANSSMSFWTMPCWRSWVTSVIMLIHATALTVMRDPMPRRVVA